MRTVVIKLRAVDLSTEMAEMRAWLDEYRYEPSKFTYDQNGDTVAVFMDFENEEEAEAFKDRFDGQSPRAQPGPFLLHGL